MGTQDAKVVGCVRAAERPCVFVIQLEEGASRATPAVGRGEGALQAIASQNFAPDLMGDVGASIPLLFGELAFRFRDFWRCPLSRL